MIFSPYFSGAFWVNANMTSVRHLVTVNIHTYIFEMKKKCLALWNAYHSAINVVWNACNSFINTNTRCLVENCLYGDSAGVVLRYPDKNMTCSFDDIKSRPSACYQVENKCCQQCKHFHTGITGLISNLLQSVCHIHMCQ